MSRPNQRRRTRAFREGLGYVALNRKHRELLIRFSGRDRYRFSLNTWWVRLALTGQTAKESEAHHG